MISVSLIIIFLAGLCIGWLLYQRLLRLKLIGVKHQADELAAEVQQASDKHRQESTREREQARSLFLGRLTDEQAQLQEQLSEAEKSAQLREDRLDERRHSNKAIKARVEQREQALKAVQQEAHKVESTVEQTLNKKNSKLEERANTSSKSLRDELVSEVVEAKKGWLVKEAKQRSEHLEETADQQAKHLIKSVLERYAGTSHLERLQNQIEVPNSRAFAVLSDPENPSHQTLTQTIGFELQCVEAKKNTLFIRGDDPLAREIARRVLRQLANRSITAPNKIRSIAARTKEEVEREVQNAGRKAARLFGMKNIDPEVMELVGRLKFRLSYSQNQLKHAIEVAHLSGLLAEELGLNVSHARRGGLLHDIGKALTHEREGSHAVIGAEIARRCGEEEVVANAIGSHHHDEPMETPISKIVTAADALSGARPGARRETATLFLERMKQIESIASRDPKVERVEIMHAGREVRVIVGGETLGHEADDTKKKQPTPDGEMHPLAEAIAQEIEDDVIYPGQVRVTVIRESRATTIAH